MLDITVFEGAKDTTPHAMQYSWSSLCDLLEGASEEPCNRGAKLNRLAYI